MAGSANLHPVSPKLCDVGKMVNTKRVDLGQIIPGKLLIFLFRILGTGMVFKKPTKRCAVEKIVNIENVPLGQTSPVILFVLLYFENLAQGC
jgi:hypothetical protein